MKETGQISAELIDLVTLWETRLRALSSQQITVPRNRQNRNIKQILGHLIDSVSNNTHRVIHLQNLPSPLVFPNYASFGNNDRWIAIQNYENEDWQDMISLLKYSLLHYCHVIGNINDDYLENEWIAGPGRYIPLREMVLDFLRHFKLHLSEIEELL
jgi:hypothetical protein